MVEYSALLVFALIASLQLAAGQTLPTPWTQGIATHYGGAQDGMDPSSPSFGTSEGSCGYKQLSTTSYPFWSVAALSTSNKYSLAGPSLACGQCFEIACLNSGGQFAGRCSSSQSITVTITDSCPECEPDHIDIQALSFNKIAPMALGRIDIQYRRVDCTPPEAVQVAIDNNVGVGGWLRLVVEKTAGFGGITLVQMRTSGTGSWISMNNEFGSAWEISNTPNLPWDFQFTSDSKQSVQAYSLVNQNGQVGSIPTGVQFSLSGTSGAQDISYGGSSGSSPPSSTGATTPPTSAQSSPPTTTQAVPPPVQAATTPPAGSQSQTEAQKGCCVDTTPPGGLTCEQQQGYGKCQASWMTAGGFCQLTCGNCPASCSSSDGSAATYSISGTPPTSATTPPAATTPSQTQSGTPASTSASTSSTCDDNAPPGSTEGCSALAAKGLCYTTIGAGYCSKSCYRC